MGETEKGEGVGDKVEEHRVRGVGWADLGKEVLFQTTMCCQKMTIKGQNGLMNHPSISKRY